jgi:predicted enzyme related to lactoylglutathione lyase
MIKSADLVWVTVSDFKKARKFFTETLGLKEISCVEEMGWMELQGQDGGVMIGVGASNDELPAGSNAIVTFTVDDIDQAVADFKTKNIQLLGKIVEIPGHVKLQMFTDLDGNKFQLVQVLDKL